MYDASSDVSQATFTESVEVHTLRAVLIIFPFGSFVWRTIVHWI